MRERGDVLRALVRVALQQAIQYRSSFLLNFLVGGVTSVAVVFPLFFAFGDERSVEGWNLHEAMLVTAFFQVYAALVGGIVEPNLGAIVEGVRSGALDYLLLKPVDSQLVATFNRIDPARIWDLLGGLLIGAYALSFLPAPTATHVAVAFALLGSGLFAMYGLWMLVICLSFYFVKVDNLRYLLGAAADAGRWPVSVYKGLAYTLVTVLVPVALVTSWPAMAVLGRMDVPQAANAVAVAVGLLIVSRFAWKRAIGRYTSASS